MLNHYFYALCLCQNIWYVCQSLCMSSTMAKKFQLMFRSYALEHSTYWVCCTVAGNFRGVLISVIFVIHPDVTNFPPTKIFYTLCNAVYTCSNFYRRRFAMALFRYLQCPWSTESPISMCPACEGWGSELRSVEGRNTTKRNRPSTSHRCASKSGCSHAGLFLKGPVPNTRAWIVYAAVMKAKAAGKYVRK